MLLESRSVSQHKKCYVNTVEIIITFARGRRSSYIRSESFSQRIIDFSHFCQCSKTQHKSRLPLHLPFFVAVVFPSVVVRCNGSRTTCVLARRLRTRFRLYAYVYKNVALAVQLYVAKSGYMQFVYMRYTCASLVQCSRREEARNVCFPFRPTTKRHTRNDVVLAQERKAR